MHANWMIICFSFNHTEQGLPEDALHPCKPATTALKHGLISILRVPSICVAIDTSPAYNKLTLHPLNQQIKIQYTLYHEENPEIFQECALNEVLYGIVLCS